MRTLIIALVGALALTSASAYARAPSPPGGGHGGHGDHGGKGGGSPAASPAPSAPSAPAAEAGGSNTPDGFDTRGDSSRRQFCYRHPGDYWCKEGAPFIKQN